MATVHPFRALRPRREFVEAVVATVPNEVIGLEEARKLVEKQPLSFLRVIKPEVDLVQCETGKVYEKGAENLQELICSSYFTKEDRASLYVYGLEHDGKAQTGVFGCVAVGEYDDGTIVRHEKTRPDKEDDRVRHVLAQQAHTEPVMLTYRQEASIQEQVEHVVATEEPLFDFEDEDEVRHTVWRIDNSEPIVEAFGQIPRLYVADGHHRCKAASRAAARLRESGDVTGEAEFFPAVLFPMDQMTIKAYNRVVYEAPLSEDNFLKEMDALSGVERNVDESTPSEKGTVCFYINGSWHRFVLPPAVGDSVSASLDVSRLSAHVLKPILGITNSRLDANIGFVSGRQGVEELERLVDERIADLAFSLYPTSIDELVRVADAGELMPPKSTWFEPKLRSGMLIHCFSREQHCSPVEETFL